MSLFSQIDPDKEYLLAVDFYKVEDNQLSLKHLNNILTNFPDYSDARVLRIRIFHRMGNIEESAEDLYVLLSQNFVEDEMSLYFQHIESIQNVSALEEFWKKTMLFFEENQSYSIAVAKRFLSFNDEVSAKEIINGVKVSQLDSEDRYQLQLLFKVIYNNQVSIAYEWISFLDDYTTQGSWNAFSIEYQYKYGLSTYLARITQANRFSGDGTLFELESYPVFSKRLYSFVNVSFSNNSFFQNYGVSTSLFYSLNNGLELEGGARYLNFSEEDFFAGVIGVSYYWDSFLFNGRAFLGPKKSKTFLQNYQINIRYYLNNPEEFLFLRMGLGISPDDSTLFTLVNNNPDLEAKYVNIGLYKTFQRIGAIASIGYLNENLVNDRIGNQINASVNLKYRF
jgi:YaiO family outer membrane protein